MTEITPEAISTVTFRDRTWCATCRSLPGAPYSSLTRLVQGIWESEPGQARAILRRRILTTDPLTPMNWGMVKTAAQRVTSLTSLETGPGWEHVDFTPDPTLPALAPSEQSLAPMELAFALAGRARREGELYRRDRPVGCVLLDPAGERVAWAHNNNRSNRTLHAEVNLIQGLWARTGTGPMPGSRLVTTLEPCRMCQGMLHDCAPYVHVVYAEGDEVPPVPWKLDLQRAS